MGGTVTNIPVSFDASSTDIARTIGSIASPYSDAITVTHTDLSGDKSTSHTWDVTFAAVKCNTEMIQVILPDMDECDSCEPFTAGISVSENVVEVVSGSEPLDKLEFNLTLEGPIWIGTQNTASLPIMASTQQVKNALESLPSVESVTVNRLRSNAMELQHQQNPTTGWSLTFHGNVGNLPPIRSSHPYITTRTIVDGSSTFVSGTFKLAVLTEGKGKIQTSWLSVASSADEVKNAIISAAMGYQEEFDMSELRVFEVIKGHWRVIGVPTGLRVIMDVSQLKGHNAQLRVLELPSHPLGVVHQFDTPVTQVIILSAYTPPDVSEVQILECNAITSLPANVFVTLTIGEDNTSMLPVDVFLLSSGVTLLEGELSALGYGRVSISLFSSSSEYQVPEKLCSGTQGNNDEVMQFRFITPGDIPPITIISTYNDSQLVLDTTNPIITFEEVKGYAAFVAEVQRIDLSPSVSAGGYWLSTDTSLGSTSSEFSAYFPWNATAEEILAASLPGIASVHRLNATGNSSISWIIEFGLSDGPKNMLWNPCMTTTGQSEGSTDGCDLGVLETPEEQVVYPLMTIHRVRRGYHPISGFFTLSLEDVQTGQRDTLPPLNF